MRVIISLLPEPQVSRLRRCTGVRTCDVIVDGIEQRNPTRIVASTIEWQN